MKYFVSLVILAAMCFGQSNAHGMMLDPPSRSSRWRTDRSAPINYDDNALYCGGFYVHQLNGGQCGLCGDNFASPTPRANEIGGSIGGSGVITRSIWNANTLTVTVRITTNHRGYFIFNLCNLDEFGGESEDCFKRNQLVFPDGSDRLYIGTTTGQIETTVILPDDLTCEHCVLRWTYVAGNNWGICPDGTGALGCGPQETFINCADISIFSDLNPIDALTTLQAAGPESN